MSPAERSALFVQLVGECCRLSTEVGAARVAAADDLPALLDSERTAYAKFFTFAFGRSPEPPELAAMLAPCGPQAKP
jgi:hypothetical protein